MFFDQNSKRINMLYDDTSIKSIFDHANKFINKTLSDVISKDELNKIVEEIHRYGNKRKGHFGDLVEEYLFGIKNNSDAAADFPKVGLELKTTPLKRLKNNKISTKEKLSFSMINYIDIVHEEWKSSSFLKKNKLLLLMFYMYSESVDLTKYQFEYVHLLDLLSDISPEDIAQIKQDWQKIVDKIAEGKAHLLSGADTIYLSAATKSSSGATRQQPYSDIPAKPRAFALKQSYLNFIVQKYYGKEDKSLISLLEDKSLPITIEENIQSRFRPHIGRINVDMEKELGIFYDKKPPKHRRRLLINKLFGAASNKIIELEKADITLRVIALEPSGTLNESVSFPKFDYHTVSNEAWEDSLLYELLTSKRFLFVIFRKNKDGTETLESIKFWNIPVDDLHEAQWVWETTAKRIKEKRANELPGLKDSKVMHVRPHGRLASDTSPTGYGTNETKKSFWFNASYIKNQLEVIEFS